MNYTKDFDSRSDLSKYSSNSLLLYALQLRYEISDITAVASEALTDGGNDKKCDLIYVDQDIGIAIIAQGYMKQNPASTDLAPSNKASDLNTAAAWVFSQSPEDTPKQIRDQVRLLQTAIDNGSITTIYFWYVHNLNERNNPVISDELVTMQSSARAQIKTRFPDTELSVFALEVGNETIEKWYNASTKRITITETISVETVESGFEIPKIIGVCR